MTRRTPPTREEPLYEEFVTRVRELTERLTVGQSTGLGTADIGAVTYPPQLDLIDDHVKDAVTRGARVDHSMGSMREGTFGAHPADHEGRQPVRAEGIRKYTQVRSVMVNKHPLRRDVHMMSFRPSGYRFALRLVDVLNGRFRSR